jgi:hypothetical protein
MTKFIELHTYNNSPIYINLESIAYIQEEYQGVMVYFNTMQISSKEKGGMLNKIETSLKRILVTESYSKVKSLIEE